MAQNWSNTQVAHMWDTVATRKWQKWPTCVPRRWHTHTHTGQTAAARRCRKWRNVCATQVAHTWRKLGQHAGGAHMPQTGGSTQVAQIAHVCASQVAQTGGQTGAACRLRKWSACVTWRELGQQSGGTHMPQTGAARRWHKWRMCVPRMSHTHGANLGHTQVAHLAHVCVTQVARTWRHPGQHAGDTDGPRVHHAAGTHMGQTRAARRWRNWCMCVPFRWHTHGAN